MLGLGVGSLAGGELSKRLGARLLIAFGLVEVGIGLFGLLSLRLFAFIGSFTSGWSLAGAGLACFLMLLVPTTLMGATLRCSSPTGFAARATSAARSEPSTSSTPSAPRSARSPRR